MIMVFDRQSFMHIAIFGSAFNPPTLGHADAIASIFQQVRCDQVWLIPAYQHAFAKTMLDYPIRVAMLAQFVADLDDNRIVLCDIEHQIAQANRPVYTWDLLHHLSQKYANQHQFSFVIGPDNQANWHKFYKAQEIADRWSVIAVPERKQIRSSKVRHAIQKDEAFAHMLTPSVGDYVLKNKLYRNGGAIDSGMTETKD